MENRPAALMPPGRVPERQLVGAARDPQGQRGGLRAAAGNEPAHHAGGSALGGQQVLARHPDIFHVELHQRAGTQAQGREHLADVETRRVGGNQEAGQSRGTAVFTHGGKDDDPPGGVARGAVGLAARQRIPVAAPPGGHHHATGSRRAGLLQIAAQVALAQRQAAQRGATGGFGSRNFGKQPLHEPAIPGHRHRRLRLAVGHEQRRGAGVPAGDFFARKGRAEAVHGAAVLPGQLGGKQTDVTAQRQKVRVHRTGRRGVQLAGAPAQLAARETAHAAAHALVRFRQLEHGPARPVPPAAAAP